MFSSWGGFFEGSNVNPRKDLGQTQSAGAVLLITIDERQFAISFGHSHHVLNKEILEDRFGLLVVLNSIDAKRIKSIDKDAFDAISKKSRESSARDAETQEFGLDVEQDLLRAVTGIPRDTSVARLLSGKESLRAVGEFNLVNFKSGLKTFLSRFEEDSYKADFPWVDNIVEIRDYDRLRQLDNLLEIRIADNPSDVWLAPPDVIDWQRISGFTYGPSRKMPIIYDMHLESFMDSLKPGACTVDLMRRRQVLAVDINDQIIDSWSVYRCLHAELSIGKEAFLLSNGKCIKWMPTLLRE